ncbi:MAG: patatin [Epsilonproteobacteria bacterium]|nr:patatin [Campylobacterota bacterium]
MNKKTVSLVLGSGGARGYAHIGVIEVLIEQGYEIKSISGTSMGALIGALYACGKLDVYKKWILTLNFFDVAKLLDFSFGNAGLIQGEKIFKILAKIIGSISIEDLDIPYTAVATDLMKQKEVWINKGKLLDAVRASIAIPTIFTPKKIGNRYLIDGSILNPIPIAPTILDDTELTIAVNLNAKIKKVHKVVNKDNDKEENPNFYSKIEKKFEHFMHKQNKSEFYELGILGVMVRSVETMQKVLTEYKIAGYSPNILIDIPSNSCEFYEFDRAKEMIQLGRETTENYLKDLS